MTKSPRDVAESYWRAECSRDLEAIMSHFHPDAEFRPSGVILRGHEEIRTFYVDSIARFPGLECRIIHEVANGNEASLEWDAILTGVDGTCNSLVGVNIVQVDGSMIRRMRAYFDQSTFYGTRDADTTQE